MKMSFDKIIFDKFSPRGVNNIFTDVITRTKTAIIDADWHCDLGRAQLRKLFEKVPGGNIKRLLFLDNIPPKILAKAINNLESVRFDSKVNINEEAMVEIFRQMSEETKLKKIFFLYSCLYFRQGYQQTRHI